MPQLLCMLFMTVIRLTQNIRDKLMHSFHSRQILSPSKTGCKVSAHRLINIAQLTQVQATLQF